MDAAGQRFGFKRFEIAPRVLEFASVAFAFPGSIFPHRNPVNPVRFSSPLPV
jgi:hypothetical protein